ncbi:hypothetical protein [Tenacibaculum xiamenense]|uniref:hypothetical protein n=1 Tax=Tenacibaculum xiamenense TaxID=1261553 RepID=UPI003895D67B
MSLNAEKTKYDNELSVLINKSICEVSYFEINYGEPNYDLGDHHSLDYGIQIEDHNGDTYYMVWDSQYYQFDLKFKRGHIINEFSSEPQIQKHIVSKSIYWINRINQKIKSIESYWSYVSHGNFKKTYYPQDIEISFENELNVIISALEIRSDGTVNSMADHVSLFFDSETALRYGAK